MHYTFGLFLLILNFLPPDLETRCLTRDHESRLRSHSLRDQVTRMEGKELGTDVSQCGGDDSGFMI